MSLGTTGYSLYVGSLWAFQVHGTRAFLIVAGGILGCTAALLWAAQGVTHWRRTRDDLSLFSGFFSRVSHPLMFPLWKVS